MTCGEGCTNCRFYTLVGNNIRCEWFESRISKVFPRWVEDFRLGKLRFCGCGFFERRAEVKG